MRKNSGLRRKKMNGKRSLLKVLCVVFSAALLWFSAAVTDHCLVFVCDEKPVFCVSAKVRENTTVYNGVGYSYTFTYDGKNAKQVWFENFLNANQYWITYY